MKSIFFASLSSSRLPKFLLGSYQFPMTQREVDVVVFDQSEILNRLLFHNSTPEDQLEFIEDTIGSIHQYLYVNGPFHGEIIRFSDFQNQISDIVSAVHFEYYSNQSFKRHCNSQIFRNLQPKLRTIGVSNHKSPFVGVLAPFLLNEISMHLFILMEGKYTTICGLEREMEIMCAIKEGKYPAFQPFLKFNLNYRNFIQKPIA